jgi:cobalamin synthase
MIIAGVIGLLGGLEAKYRVWGGVLGIILGIIYIILGTLAFDPIYLGFIIGIWLFLTGIFSFFASD